MKLPMQLLDDAADIGDHSAARRHPYERADGLNSAVASRWWKAWEGLEVWILRCRTGVGEIRVRSFGVAGGTRGHASQGDALVAWPGDTRRCGIHTFAARTIGA